ncbi:MAG: phosphoribosylaminoimidazolesuccinocarboxamide synthase [Alphaproteobacteria bacterium]|jgi:phosphoribosylaminoimidazole carboxylase PurE protein|nr:phosphoribosylaminoimidazolesuccinocarboxamide synthase [Alphaproteobacteria bacterium]MDP6568138.1 phosphoribosylaminoimidazolesuccinocarboxamide synthase [Alphaproteobacteria bacterium]MDP6816145.1 phosphoribosylaminoimidazolesuccinocarboxamide synthase [Alphaproteobacteria bacterium]
MGIETADRPAADYPLGALLTEGKTKKIHQVEGNPELVVVVSKDDITAGDGAKHDLIADKGRLANQTACNVFRLLAACDIPIAFTAQTGDTTFVAPGCRMLPYEVVLRREAHGSFLKRNPHLAKGQLFPRLLTEFYLKTEGRRWKDHELTCDDPYMRYTDGEPSIALFDPARPLHGQEPFLELPVAEVFSEPEEWRHFAEMRRIAAKTFLVLEKAWQIEGRSLVDFKVEFGLDANDTLLLADVIDNDSWRVVEDGAYIDKQVYRDGGALDDVASKFRRVAELTGRFRLPRQRIVIWRGSPSDDVGMLVDAAQPHFPGEAVQVITCSAHKEPVAAAANLARITQEVPNSVLIAYIGRSNGAGPTLSATTTLPVITVPANVKDFPDDVWSSLRAPSKVPVLTVLEPSNAVLAALQILAARNPRIYAHVRADIEARMQNVVQV